MSLLTSPGVAVLLVINSKYSCDLLGFLSQRTRSVLRYLPAPGSFAQALGSTASVLGWAVQPGIGKAASCGVKDPHLVKDFNLLILSGLSRGGLRLPLYQMSAFWSKML